jgi:thymidylate synthase ThyX
VSEPETPDDDTIRILDHGFVRLDDAMADDLSVINGARVSFAKRKTEMSEADEGLIRFLMRDRHGSPFEHNAFRFHVRCPIFVAREWFRHRIGCLTGDTQITFVNGDGHVSSRKTIDEIVGMWQGGERSAHRRLRRMRLRVLNEQTREFTSGQISGVIDKGMQPVYRLTLADGKQITLTENHELLTTEGWRLMKDAVGLAERGAAAQMTRSCDLLVNGTPVHQVGSASSRAVEDVEVPSRRGFKLTAHPSTVVAIEYVGIRQTYDLSISGPWHNFVADGIVVHNSFNEFSMRYAKATDDFYVPEAADVRSQVGKPGAYSFEPVSDELAEQAREEIQAVYAQAYETYTRLVEAGVARELARSVMPVGAYTQFYWTVNARALMNFVSLRNAEFAQLEIRRYGEAVESFFADRMPVTYAAFVENNRLAP